MSGKKVHYLALAALLLASGCGSDSGRSAKTPRFEVELQCEIVSAVEIAPQTAVYAIVNQNKVKIASVSNCAPILPQEYEDYDIPAAALAAVGGWWAGAGDYFYAIEEDGTIVFYQGAIGEMQEDEDFQYQKLARFEAGRFSIQLPGEAQQ